MHALDHEEAGTGALVEAGELLGVEGGGVPVAQHLFVAYLGGVAVALHVVAVGVVVNGLLIEVAGIPVAALAGRLGTEVYPETDLGLAQPLGFAGVVGFDGLPGGLEGTVGDGDVELHLFEGADVAQLDGAYGFLLGNLGKGGEFRHLALAQRALLCAGFKLAGQGNQEDKDVLHSIDCM